MIKICVKCKKDFFVRNSTRLCIACNPSKRIAKAKVIRRKKPKLVVIVKKPELIVKKKKISPARAEFNKMKRKTTKPDKCQECKITTKKLDYHHIDKNKRNNSQDNLIFLCKNCHRIKHPELPDKLFA